MKVNGGCHCGRISFTAEIDPRRVTICHCKDCQLLSSSAFRVSVLTARENLQVTGAPKSYAKTADSGAIRLQPFCPDCGTPIFNTGPESEIGDCVIRWGSIQQRDQLMPARQTWCGSAAAWIGDLGRLPSWEAAAPPVR
ncbi:MAG: GFA family protein [Tardiphaga sp.]|nr:GFA family protein [Tardiphaga sp.]